MGATSLSSRCNSNDNDIKDIWGCKLVKASFYDCMCSQNWDAPSLCRLLFL